MAVNNPQFQINVRKNLNLRSTASLPRQLFPVSISCQRRVS